MTAERSESERTGEASGWLLSGVPRPQASHRAYVFPHSGGSVLEYLKWSPLLPDTALYGVQPLGRGARLREPALTRMPDLVRAILDAVIFKPPYLFFGHSLGALVAYEVAAALREANADQPFCLLASSCRPPHLAPIGPLKYQLTDDELLEVVASQYASIPPEAQRSRRFRRIFLPCLRADFAVAESYVYVERAPLACPIIALGGTEDGVSREELAKWAGYTSVQLEVRQFPGGHFYLREQQGTLITLLRGAARFLH